MGNNKTYPWTDNPTEAGKADCNPDVLNDCLMYLRYNAATGNGIPPMAVKGKDILTDGAKRTLTWSDPDNSIIEGVELATWGGTLIVRKEGSYPDDFLDGTVVCDNTVRNQYATDGFVDTVPDETKDYYYRAFPYTVNKVYNMSNANKFGVWLMGYCELDNEATPSLRISYLEENENYEPCKMNFTSDLFEWHDWLNHPLVNWNNVKPCMVYNQSSGQNGKVAYYLNPNDHTLIYNSTTKSDISNLTFAGNAMVEFRKVFTKVVTKNDGAGKRSYVYFSNIKYDSGFECYWCKRADGTYNEYAYVPMFSGTLVDNVMRSIAGLQNMNGQTAEKEINFARANGDGWDTETFAMNQYLIRLFKLLFKNTNSQAVLGNGYLKAADSKRTTANSCIKTGTTLDKGAMWGSTANNFAMKFMYIENFYANQWRRYRGYIVINGVHYIKMTKSTVDGSTAMDYNLTGDGYIKLDIPAITGTLGGYISEAEENQYGRFATVASGSATTNACDIAYFNNGITAYPFRGGSSNDGAGCGVSCFDSNSAATAAGWAIGAALSYTPL